MAPVERNYDMSKGGVKWDQDKPEWSLLPIKSCLEGVVRVLMYGAQKYSRDNWKNGMPWQRVVDAAKRHILAWDEGEDLDVETGLNHIDHALCELIFLRYYILHGIGQDDRYRRPRPKLDPTVPSLARVVKTIQQRNLEAEQAREWRDKAIEEWSKQTPPVVRKHEFYKDDDWAIDLPTHTASDFI